LSEKNELRKFVAIPAKALRNLKSQKTVGLANMSESALRNTKFYCGNLAGRATGNLRKTAWSHG